MDAANLMKPALSRGDLHCIGATTIAEYRRYIEKDPALERRFEKIVVNEPSPDEALEILKGLRKKWEDHHHVRITDQALKDAVELSIRFDGDHQLPDKAIDLVDKAAAQVRIPLLSMIFDDKEKVNPSEGKDSNLEDRAEVNGSTIARVISEKVCIPLEVVTGQTEGMTESHLLGLEAYLKGKIIGQDDAIQCVCQRLLMDHTGLAKRRGTLAVFLFLGPSGVGKTELARSLAEYLFGSDDVLIRLDMSEFMEEHSGAKLIGSPPGYIGYEEEGQLTGKLRTKPYSVVLLDEVEKAHPNIFDLFLQVFDEGRLTDSKGRTVDARNAIFVMTSNISAEKEIGFKFKTPAEIESMVIQEVGKRFRREFINRIDEQIVFRSLDEDDIRKILMPMLDEIMQNLQTQHQVSLYIQKEVEGLLVHAGYNPQYGARELRRTVERLVQVPLSQLVLSGELKEHKKWRLVCTEEEIKIIPFKQKP